MIFTIEYSHLDAIDILRKTGLQVEMQDQIISFPTFNGQTIDEIVPIWMVKHPELEVWQTVTEVFQRMLDDRAKQEFRIYNPEFTKKYFKV